MLALLIAPLWISGTSAQESYDFSVWTANQYGDTVTGGRYELTDQTDIVCDDDGENNLVIFYHVEPQAFDCNEA